MSLNGENNQVPNGLSNGTSTVPPCEWRDLKPTMWEGMSHLLETGLYTDLSFEVGPTGYTFNAHKLILMMRSEVFALKFNERWSPSVNQNRMIINVPDKTPQSFKHFLTYLYTDEFPQKNSYQDLLEILDLAHLYQVPGLISICSKLLELKIGDNSCVEIYQRTRLYTELGLSDLALTYLNKNISSVAENVQFLLLDVPLLTTLLLTDDLPIDELDLFKALLRWGNAEDFLTKGDELSRKDHMKLLIPFIRFLLMSPNEFATEVVPTKVLEDTLALKILCCLNGGSEESERLPEIWSKPRLSIVLEEDEIECYHMDDLCSNFTLCPIVQSMKRHSSDLASEVIVPQLRFRCSSPIIIRGLKIYGISRKAEEKQGKTVYRVKFSISSADQPPTSLSTSSGLNKRGSTCITIQKVQTTLQNFDVLLEKPFQTVANQSYWISASLATEGFSGQSDKYYVSHGLRKMPEGDVVKIMSKTGNVSFEIGQNRQCTPFTDECSGWNRLAPLGFRGGNNFISGFNSGIVHSILFINRIATSCSEDSNGE